MCIDDKLDSICRLAMAIFLHTFSGDGIFGPPTEGEGARPPLSLYSTPPLELPHLLPSKTNEK
jgi:hypothetical protein